MIPLKLTLRNFLSYRDTAELDLTGIHLACISGPNGVGKSSILEGITWALFGKSRVRSDDDIVNRFAAASGGTAEVSFVFELEGAVYRVIRRKAPGKTAALEFNARMPGEDDDHWQVLTEAKLRETEAEIEKLLRMNYEVFTNASFLLQGKADEFTTKTADRRKAILADILGVTLWDDYKEQATQRRKEIDAQVTAVDHQVAEVEAELAREAEYVQALEHAQLHVKAVTAERDRQDALVSAARQNKALADQQRESMRRITAELGDLEGELTRIEDTVAERRAELAGYRSLLDRREAITAAFGAWQEVTAEFAVWQSKAEQHAAISQELNPLNLAIALAENRLQQRVNELKSQQVRAEKAAAELEILRASLAGLETQREQLQAQVASLEEQQSKWQEARDRLQALEFGRKMLEQDLIQLQARATEITNMEVEREQVDASLRANATTLEETQRDLQELAAKRDLLADRSNQRSALDTEKRHLLAQMDALKERMTGLEAGVGDDCPLCGQPFTAEHRQHAIQQIQSEGSEHAAQFRKISPVIKTLEQEIGELEKALQQQPLLEKKRDTHQAAVSRIEERLKNIDNSLAAWREGDEDAKLAELEQKISDESESATLTARVAQFQTAADEARQLSQNLRQVEGQITHDRLRLEDSERVCDEWETKGLSELAEKERQLAEGAFAEAERASLRDVEARLAVVAYDAEAHTAVRSRRDELSAAPDEHQRLQQAEAAVKPLTDGLGDLDRQRKRATTSIAKLRIDCEQAKSQLEALEAGIGDLPTAELELQRLREDAVAANRAEGGARQKVEVLAVRREDRKQLAARRKDLTHQISLLRQLEEACGRKGVQALLIDAALPEIEAYANNLLMSLSGGDMHVKFETKRAAKSKQDSLIETLDIIISDSYGVRPYENYSGGEKFRVNFAIRLALSQVLARRAGARLRTLVIDEGFGSQDPEGRQRLVEAINAVQSEFACILVITHIDELRDKFPARIDVEKTAAGSRLSVVTI